MDNGMVLVFIGISGVVYGSFLNVLIYRIPRGENIAVPPSHCPHCQSRLHWYHNIPILSWIGLKGKCAFCSNHISPRYPLVELTNAFLWILLFLKIGWSWYFPFIALSFSSLLALSLIDIEYFAVPDSLNFFALLTALVSPVFPYNLKDAALAGAGLWLLGYIVSKIAKKEAMGSADAIVAATMAALLGFPLFFISLFISALLAIIPSLFARDSKVPFVPFLALGTLIVYLEKEWFLNFLSGLLYG